VEQQPGGSLCFVSAAYAGVRPDRTMDYYHRPLLDFLRAYRASGGRAVLTVHANGASWERAPGLMRLVDEAIEDEPGDHVRAVWPDPDWQRCYQQLIRRNPTHAESYQARFPRLIAVYLSKLRLVELAFERGGYEAVLWHDAGHWVSHACEHDIRRYSAAGPEQTRGELLDRLLRELTEDHPVVGTLSRPGRERFHMPISWMREHAAEIDPARADALVRSLYTAVLWAFRREAFAAFAAAFREAWAALVRRAQAGIEENAMTIAAWRQNTPGLAYPAWRRLLAGSRCSGYIVRPGEESK
jgi:hypothetical protein